MKKFLIALAATCLLAVASRAQTTVNGTFKAPNGQTPQAAGLTVLQQVAGTNVCGQLDFQAYDSSGNKAIRLIWNGVTYFPERVRAYVRCSDGALISSAGTVGVSLIPNLGSTSPAGTVYQLNGFLAASSDGTIQGQSWAEQKQVPDQPSVDWYSLAVAVVQTPAFAYVLQNDGQITDFVDIGGRATAPVNPAAGNCRYYFNTTTGILSGINSSGASCMPAGGSGSLNVNGLAVSSPNLNATSPAADANFLSATWKVSGSNVIAELPTFVASGASHAIGLVPDPGATAGSLRFLNENATWAQPAFSGISGTAVVSQGGTGLVTLVAHELYVGNGISAPNPVVTGNAGQVLISNGASVDPTFQDPIVSQAYVTIFSAQSATTTATSSPVRLPTFSGNGTIEIVGSGITGSPSGCSITLAYQANTGSPASAAQATISFTLGNTDQPFAVSPTNPSGDQYVATYSCGTYPTGGTFSVTFSPTVPVNIVGTPAVSISGTPTVNQGGAPWLIAGNVASGASDSGNPTKVGGVFNATQPTVTAGQRIDVQATARGALIVGTGVDAFNVTVNAALPVGANTIGNVNAIESGTWTVQPGNTANTTPWLTTDSSDMGGTVPGTAPSKTGIVGAIYNLSAPAPTSGQTLPLQSDSAGRLIVACTSGCGGSGGTSLSDEGVFTQGTTSFTPIGGFYNTTITNLVSGQGGALRLTPDRNLFVDLNEVGGLALTLGQTTMSASVPVTMSSNQGNIAVNIAAVGGTATSLFADNAAFTAGSTSIGITGGWYSISPTACTSGSACAPSLTSDRKMYVQAFQGTSPWVDNVTTWAGGTLGAMANYGTSPGAVLVPGVNAFVTNVPAVSQSGNWTARVVGNAGGVFDAAGQNAASSANELLVGGQFNTTPTTITSGNMSPLQLDSAGNLLVNIKVGGGAGGTSSNFSAAFPSVGTAIGAKNGANMVNLAADASNNLIVNCATGCAATGDTVGSAGTLNALNAAASVALASENGVEVFFASGGTLAGTTVVPEVSPDGGTTWQAAMFLDPVSGTMTTSVSNPTNQTLQIAYVGAESQARVRVSVFASGTVTATLRSTVTRPWNIAFGSDGTNVRAIRMATDGTVRVDPTGTTTQPISAVSLPLPTGAATAAKQPALGTAGTPSADVITVQGVASMTPVKVDGSAVTQPISAAGLPLPTGAAQDASVTGLEVAQGSTTSGQKGVLNQCAVTTSAPTYTTAQTDPLSCNPSGGLRVDGSGSTQPVSGTVSINSLPTGSNIVGKVGLDSTTPGSTNGISFYQPTRTTGTITTATSTVSVATTGMGDVGVTVNGTYAGVTINFEFSDDGGTTWYSNVCTRTDASIQEAGEALPSNQTRAWDCGVYATTNFRARASAWTSGTVNVGLTAVATSIEPAMSVAQSGAPWQENITQFGSTNISTGTGVGGAGIPRVTVSSDSSILAIQSGTWTVQPGNTANTTPWLLQGSLANNASAAATNRVAILPGIARTDYAGGTALTAGRDAAMDVGTDGLLHVAALPAMRPASYVASAKFAGSSTTDNAVLPGNASDTVLVTRVEISCTQTTAGIIAGQIIKRSAADTAGTSAAMTVVPDDSNYAAGASTPLSYTGTGPTVGAAVGDVADFQIGCLAPGTASPDDIYILNRQQKPIVLRGTPQQLAVNMGGAITGGNLTVRFEWLEVTTITP